MTIEYLHHVAIITRNYKVSKYFYTQILGFQVISENYREQRKSWKLDLQVSPQSPVQIELFSFENVPERPSRPEAAGARHLCFAVKSLSEWIVKVNERLERAKREFPEGEWSMKFEDVRYDEYTNEVFVFIADPDDLPIEFKQINKQNELYIFLLVKLLFADC